jgi:hypothetical protein
MDRNRHESCRTSNTSRSTFSNLGKEAMIGRGSNTREVSIVSLKVSVLALGNTTSEVPEVGEVGESEK